MVTELLAPLSRGEVTLKSTDPTENPLVDHNHLGDPLGLDMLVMSEGCRMANEIVMKGSGTKDIIRGAWPSKLAYHTYKSRDEWMPEIRQRADTCKHSIPDNSLSNVLTGSSGYHPAGTCKMGKDNDPMAVVDSKLRVRGVERLRVADASIMPTLMCGHPQMAVYGIAEKVAEMIKNPARDELRN